MKNMSQENRPLRTVKSFVKRARVTPKQQHALDFYWPLYGIEPNEGAIDYPFLFNRQAPTILEIGFGMGISLIELARTHPEFNFIGIEVHVAGIGATLAAINELKLTNLLLLNGDAVPYLEKYLPKSSLAGVLLFFPDPWPKTRHHKRRIVQPKFVELVYSVLANQGYFHLATDVADYAEHMRRVVKCHPGFHNTNQGSEIGIKVQRPSSKFELRAKRKGDAITDLVFIKQEQGATYEEGILV